MSNEKKTKIIDIISKVAKIDSKLIKDSSCMNDFPKWDSLAHLNIMLELEKQFKKKVSTSKMIELNSVSKIAHFFR